jgi:phosphate transport system permease protein
MTVVSYSADAGRTAFDHYTRAKSSIIYGLCVVFTVLIVTLLLLVTGYLISLGYKWLDVPFFTKDLVAPGAEGFPGGMRNGIVGSAILIGLASTVGIPVGMLAGIYLSEYSSRSFLATPVRFIADVLTGVPSIVVGILGYELLVVPIGHYNGWAGSLALAFIMIPLVARTTEEMLLLVPRSYREASVALGATKARTILKVVLPAAFGSVVTGVILAVARVAGETAPLLFTALGSRFLEKNPNEPFPSLTRQIYDGAMSPYHELNQQAWAGILVLLALIFVLNVGVRLTVRAMSIKK